MVDLRTRYMGLELRTPLIVSASGLTKSADAVKECAAADAGAVVLKSIFEEQIEADLATGEDAHLPGRQLPEAYDFIKGHGRDRAVERYLETIAEARAVVDIPVIASIHCVSAGNWTHFARKAQDAGASAIELNVFIPPMDPRRTGAEIERTYFDIAREVRHAVTIPVAMKIGPYFSGLSNFAVRLSNEVDALVLFNRFFRLDFDIDRMALVPASMISEPSEIEMPLRWISILSGRVHGDISASTGVHDGRAVIKALLAGATSVQVCSTLYENGLWYLAKILADLRAWMESQGFSTIEEFRGRMRQLASSDPSAYERVQFMKIHTGIE
jgi:dihydroorotate dehydrogenase (fumarate)